MGKRFVQSTCAVLLMAGSMVAVSATSASALRFFVHGNVHCTATGAVRYSPTLRNGVSQTMRARIKGNLTCDEGETGIPGITVTGGKFSAVSDYFGGDCLTIAPPSITMRIGWNATGGKIRDTNVSWTAPVATSTNPYSYHFAGGTVETLGVSGSYLGATAAVSFLSDNVTASGACTDRLRNGWSFTGLGGVSELSFQSPPSVSSVTPGQATLGTSNLDVDVNGQDFTPGNNVAFSGSGITVNSVTYDSPTDLTANISVAPDALAGMRDVTVTNDTLGSGTCSDCFMVAPIVTGVSPGSLGQGATNQNVTITGTGFANGAITAFSGNGITVNYTAFVDPNTLTANINIAPNAPLSTYDVMVVDPGFGVGSCVACFSVNPGPTVTSTTPSSRGAGATGQVVAVNGTNFATGATVSFPGSGITVTSTSFVSSTKLNATISIAPGTANGTRSVVVNNVDGGSGSCAACFTVNKGPSITDWNVLSGGYYSYENEWRGVPLILVLRQKYTTDIQITGSNFQPGAVVTYSSTDVRVNSTTFISATKIKMNITIDVLDYAANALPTDRSITLVNPDGGAATCQGCVVLIV